MSGDAEALERAHGAMSDTDFDKEYAVTARPRAWRQSLMPPAWRLLQGANANAYTTFLWSEELSVAGVLRDYSLSF